MNRRPRPSLATTVRRVLVRVLLVTGGIAVAGALAASAFWLVRVEYSGAAVASGAVLPAPHSVVVSEAGASTVDVSWSVTSTPLPGQTFEVVRDPGPTQVVVCDTTTSPCVDAGLVAGTSYTYSVESVLGDWHSTPDPTSFTALGVLSTSPPNGTYGTPYQWTLAAVGGDGPYTWSLAPGSAPLPDGLVLQGNQVQGTPTAVGQTRGIVLTATDASGATVETPPYALTVDPAPLTVTASPTVSDYGTAPTVTPIYSGFKNGDTASVVVTNAPLCTSSVLATTGVGTYPDANTCSGGAATNYTLVEVASTATVDPAPSTS